ncbi:MAG: DUF488 domain-containing protein [Thermoleophilia bacterium]|nr:DUF488 domain-containing protein [Thermoleophilia bacterium]
MEMLYSLAMAAPEWLEATDELIARALHGRNLAFMCAEGLWWRCHRSMIADYVVWRGSDVCHLQPQHTRHSAVLGDRLERYEPRVIQVWEDWRSAHPRAIRPAEEPPEE